MTAEQRKLTSKTIRGLFPSVTDEQIVLVNERLGALEYNRAVAVIKTHAANHNFLDLPALFEGFRADAAKHEAWKKNREKIRVVDWMRQQLNARGDTSHVGHNDGEVIQAWYSQSWSAIGNDPASELYGKNWARKKIYHDAINACVEVGIDMPSAVAIGEACVDLPSGGTVSAPREVFPGVIGAVA